MNDQTKFRLLWASLLFLALLNMGLIGFMWYTSSLRKGGVEFAPAARNSSFLEKNLGFTDQQIETYKDLQHEHKEQVKPLLDSSRLLKKNLFLHVTDTTFKMEQLRKESFVAEQLMVRVDELTFKHLQALRALCTPDQKKKFDELVRESILELVLPPRRNERMHRRPPHDSGRPHGEGDEPPPPPMP